MEAAGEGYWDLGQESGAYKTLRRLPSKKQQGQPNRPLLTANATMLQRTYGRKRKITAGSLCILFL